VLKLKLSKVGTATGLVLPEEMLQRLHVREGEDVFAIQTSVGYTITTLHFRVQKQIEIGEAFMDHYRDVFAALASE
jgi:antitoxin component of MazEF toxin-antitoxin module